MTMGPHRIAFFRLAVVAIVGILVAAAGLGLAAANPTEYEVKAAYLYNFGRFVEWPTAMPPSQADEFPIYVLGHDPLALRSMPRFPAKRLMAATSLRVESPKWKRPGAAASCSSAPRKISS